MSLHQEEGLLAYELQGAAVEDIWQRIVVIYNAAMRARLIPIPSGVWNVAVEDGRVDAHSLRTVQDRQNGHYGENGKIKVKGLSMTILYSV